MMTSRAPCELDDAALLLRVISSRDQSALAELFARHNQRLFNYAARLLNNTHAAEDIVQSVWERVTRMKSSEKIKSPEGLLIRMTRNACLDHLKHERYSVGLDAAADLQASNAELSHEEALIVQALATLPFETREILVMHYYSDYSFEEIAKMTGKTAGSVWTKVSRARATLKKLVMKQLRADERSILSRGELRHSTTRS